MLDRRVDVALLTRSAALDDAAGRVEVARATLERAVDAATSPAETAQAHAAFTDLAFTTGDPAEALRQTRMARAADPDGPDLLAARATAAAALGEVPATLADYTAVVDGATALVDGAAPTAPPAHRRRSRTRHRSRFRCRGWRGRRGRTADARRAYAAFTALSDLFATNGVPLAPEPACSPPTAANPTRPSDSPKPRCGPARRPRRRTPTPGR